MQENDAIISPDQTYRYLLTRRVQGNGNTQGLCVLWVMVNPSTANADVDDATIRKVMGYSRRWGATHARVVNLYALRSRDVRMLATHYEPVGPENDSHITLQCGWADQVICAWGSKDKLRGVKGAEDRILRVMQIIRSSTRFRNIPVYCLGQTQGGDPLHPLTTSYSLERQEFFR